MWSSEPINKDVTHENMQELVQSKEKSNWKKLESKQLSEEDLQQKNIREFDDLKWFIGEGFYYKDNKWLYVKVTISEKFWDTAIFIEKKKNEWKIWIADNSMTSLRLDKNGDFYVYTLKDYKDGSGNKQNQRLKINISEVWEYLQAVKNRIKDYKNSVKNNFIELSVNEDKKDADNLIETIGEQTA